MTDEKPQEQAKGIPKRQIVIEIEGAHKVHIAKDESASNFELIAILQFLIGWIERGRK